MTISSIIATNEELLQMCASLKPLLEMRDVIGWVAAMNFRTLSERTADYERIRDGLIAEYGTQEVDSEGNFTGTCSIDVNSPDFKKFVDAISDISNIKQEVQIRILPSEDACDKLTGEELLSCWWMFEAPQEQCEPKSTEEQSEQAYALE